MIALQECITNTTPVFVTSDKEPRKSLFRRVEKPRKYFIKEFNPAEFIGEELCRIQNIRCSHYFIAGLSAFNLKAPIWYEDAKERCYDFKIASENFHQPGYEYKSVAQYGLDQYDKDLFERVLTVAKDEDNKKQLCHDLLQLLALDLYMGQTDRFAFNYEFEEDKDHNVRLAPLYDFQYSVNPQFIEEDDICFGDLYSFRTIEDCKDFIRKYPQFRDILSSYLGIDLEYVVREAFSKRRLVVPERKIPYYRAFDQKRKDLIKRIVA